MILDKCGNADNSRSSLEVVEVNNSLFEQLQEAVQDGPKPQEVKVVNVQKENQRKKKRKITQEDILQGQYKAIIAKKENLKLKKKET